MLLYGRYIFSRLALTWLAVTVTITGIVWLSQSLRFIDLIVNRGLSVGAFLKLASLLIPSLVGMVAPLTLFIAVLHVYHRMLTDSELTVLKTSGLSRAQLAGPALILALAGTILGYAITLYLLPVSYRAFKDYQFMLRNQYASVLLQEGVFNTPVKGLTIYIRETSGDEVLHGILVHDNRKAERPVTMMAQAGKIIRSDDGPVFELSKGSRQEIDYKTGELTQLYFDKYALELSFLETGQSRHWLEPQERFLNQLFFSGETKPEIRQKLLAEAHYRLTWPLYSLTLAMLALSIFLGDQHQRRGEWERITMASIIAVGLLLGGVGFHGAAANEPIFIAAMYGNLFMGVAAAWLLKRSVDTSGLNLFTGLLMLKP